MLYSPVVYKTLLAYVGLVVHSAKSRQ